MDHERQSALVIDDEKEIRRLVSETLRIHEYEFEVTDGVVPALKLIKDKSFDIIITDKNMPSFNGNQEGGLDILRFAKTINPNIAVVMMTGYASIESVIEAMRYGAFDFLIKPFTISSLIKKIHTIRACQAFLTPEKMMNLYKSVLLEIVEDSGKSGKQEKAGRESQLETLRAELDYLFNRIKSFEQTILEQRKILNSITTGLDDISNELGPENALQPSLRQLMDISRRYS